MCCYEVSRRYGNESGFGSGQWAFVFREWKEPTVILRYHCDAVRERAWDACESARPSRAFASLRLLREGKGGEGANVQTSGEGKFFGIWEEEGEPRERRCGIQGCRSGRTLPLCASATDTMRRGGGEGRGEWGRARGERRGEEGGVRRWSRR